MLLILLTPAPTSRRASFTALAAAIFTMAAAWLSQGTIAYTGEGTERIALLPLGLFSLALTAAAGAAAFWIVRRGASPVPLGLLGLLFLPWLPFDLPPALLLWGGRLALLVWLAVACALALALPWRVKAPVRPGVRTAALLAFVIGLTSWWQVAPQVPGGDEPHYLVITQSLLLDGDLKIQNNHAARHYASYFQGQLPPDFRVRGRDGEIYSIHAPGVSALVAPAFVAGGYVGVTLFLLAVSAAGAALAWHLAWLVTGRHDAAWFGWAAVTLSSTWIFHSFAIYPDGVGAVIVLTGVWALIRAEREAEDRGEAVLPWFWHGLALAMLPWMHTRFAVLAGGIGALVLLKMSRLQNAPAKALAFLVVPAVSFLGWMGYFIAIYGTPDPSAPYGREDGALAFVPDGLAGLLFDQRFGLLAYAPVLVFAFVGIGVMLARRPWRRHALELLFVLLPYLLVVTYIAMWWGGRSAPARFFAPLLLWMALPAAAAWASMTSRATRLAAGGALVVTAFASAVLVFAQDGALAFNGRETYALWLAWLNGAVDLARALPVWWRETEVALFRGILVWSAAGITAWLVLRWLEQRWFPAGGRSTAAQRARLATAMVLLFAAAASTAAAVTWTAEGVPGRQTTSSQLDALRRVSSDRRLLAMTLGPFERIGRGDVAQRLRLTPAFATEPGGAGRNDRPLYILPALPAGEYRLIPQVRRADGWLMLGIGRDQFAVRTVPLETARPALTITLPVDVRALIIRGDEEARQNVTGMTIEPQRLVLPEDRLTSGFARQGVRYGDAVAWFLDDRSFAEPEAFWVGGARTSEIVIQPDRPHPAEVLFMRNGAVPNTVLVETSGWREELRLGAGEERQLQVPSDQVHGATWLRITTSDGFTPSAVDPASRDHRFLGVWVRVGG